MQETKLSFLINPSPAFHRTRKLSGGGGGGDGGGVRHGARANLATRTGAHACRLCPDVNKNKALHEIFPPNRLIVSMFVVCARTGRASSPNSIHVFQLRIKNKITRSCWVAINAVLFKYKRVGR